MKQYVIISLLDCLVIRSGSVIYRIISLTICVIILIPKFEVIKMHM
jgi:hypothetical protein